VLGHSPFQFLELRDRSVDTGEPVRQMLSHPPLEHFRLKEVSFLNETIARRSDKFLLFD
jgi:hypothetical protein